MRCPSLSSLKSSSTGTPGYGDPPRVKISHSKTPNDHLQQHTGNITKTLSDRRVLDLVSRMCGETGPDAQTPLHRCWLVDSVTF